MTKRSCCAAREALDAIVQGSTIRAYGITYTTEQGERRESIALTEDQRRLVIKAFGETK